MDGMVDDASCSEAAGSASFVGGSCRAWIRREQKLDGRGASDDWCVCFHHDRSGACCCSAFVASWLPLTTLEHEPETE